MTFRVASLAVSLSILGCQAQAPSTGSAWDADAAARTFTFTVVDPRSSVEPGAVVGGTFAVGDFDGDGAQDVLFGDGELYADGKTTALFAWTADREVWSAGDVDGDGYDDVIVHSKKVSVLHLGSSSGLNTTGTTTSSSLFLSAVVPMDTDSDGHDDLWMCRDLDCELYLGTSSGLSSSVKATLGPWYLTGALSVDGGFVGDFDDDGDDELVLVGEFTDDFSSSGGGSTVIAYNGFRAKLFELSGSTWTETGWMPDDYSSISVSGYPGSTTTDIVWSARGVVPGHLSGGGDGMYATVRDQYRCTTGGCSKPDHDKTSRGICLDTTKTSTAPCAGTFTEVDERDHVVLDVDGDGAMEVAYADSKGAFFLRDGLTSGDVSALPTSVDMLYGGWDVDGDGEDELFVRDATSGTVRILEPKPGAPKDADGDGFTDATDCDDSDSSIYPGATDTIADGVDSDCDGEEVCYEDGDDDGYRTSVTVTTTDVACAGPGVALSSAPTGDCDDSDAGAYPGATEIIGDEVDQDCDGTEVCFTDGDGDGARATTSVASADLDCADVGEALASDPIDCDDGDAAAYPGAPEVIGDEVDQDCDGAEVCFVDADGDGARTTASIASVDRDCRDAGEAGAARPIDCDDADARRSPSFVEVEGDGVDQDCNGEELCFVDADDDGHATAMVVASTDLTCTSSGLATATEPRDDCDDADPLRNPAMSESVGDEVDQDCNGEELCFVDADADSWRTSGSVRSVDPLCDGPGEATASTPSGDCDDTDAAVHPGAGETIGDGVDSDCDGTELCHPDADDDGWRPPTGAPVVSADLDCTDSGEAEPGDPIGDCDDGDASSYPGATEVPGDGIDQDCDGVDAPSASRPPPPPSGCSTGGAPGGLGWLWVGLGVVFLRRRRASAFQETSGLAARPEGPLASRTR